MDVDKYAPFTSSPLDTSRGCGRRRMLMRIRPVTSRSSPKVEQGVLIQQIAEQTTAPQVGGSSNGKKTK